MVEPARRVELDLRAIRVAGVLLMGAALVSLARGGAAGHEAPGGRGAVGGDGAVASRGGPSEPLPRPGALFDPDGRLDLNAASASDLEALPHVGPERARRILALRAALGGFSAADELLQVPGIGERTLGRLLPWVVVRPAPLVRPPSATQPTVRTPNRGAGSP